MPFDVAKARADGVPEDAILQHLTATRKFDIEGAMKAGANKAQIIDHLASAPAPNAAPQKSVRERAQANQDPNSPGNELSNRVIAEAAQDEKNLYGKFAKDAALAVAAGAAAPFTGGASIPAALAIAGGAGAAGSLAGTGIQALLGSNETPKNAGDLAKVVGYDAATFAAGEGAGRLVGAVGKKLLPKLAIQTAAQVEKGKQVLLQMYGQTSKRLYDELATSAAAAGKPNWTVGVDTALKNFDQALADLPKLTDEFGKSHTALSPKAQEEVAKIAASLQSAGGNIVDQDLAGAIRQYHSFQKIAYGEKGLAAEEKPIFRKAAGEMGDAIRAAVKKAGPKAEFLFKEANATAKAELAGDTALDLTQLTLKTLLKKAGVPGGAAGVGYAIGGPIGGAVGAGIGGYGLPMLSTYVLKKALANPSSAPLFHKAVDLAIAGKGAAAAVLARKALEKVGALKDARDYIEEQESEQQAPPSLQQGVQP